MTKVFYKNRFQNLKNKNKNRVATEESEQHGKRLCLKIDGIPKGGIK